LKQAVAAEAVFSRTGKEIPGKIREEWQQKEEAKDQELHQYRFQAISMRN